MRKKIKTLILLIFSGLVLLVLSGCPPRPPMIPDLPMPPKLPKPPGLLLGVTVGHDLFLVQKVQSL